MIFGRSKKALELADAHFTKVFDCYCAYIQCIKVYFRDGNTPEAHALFERIDQLEQEADDMLRAIIQHLQSGALLPSTRKEILELCNIVDKIANNVQGISRRMIIERAYFPEEIKPGLLDMALQTQDQMVLLAKVVELLFDDYEKLMQGNASVEEIKASKEKVDGYERAVLKTVFDMDISLAEKIHAKYFITRMGDISDFIEDISDAIQMMVIFRKV